MPMSNEAEFLSASADFTAWCKTALAYWAQNGCDPRGGAYEHLFMDGTPDADHLRRVRVQARYVYVYAHAAHLGWYDCLLYTSPSPRDATLSRMPSSA